jgi:uncharacterized iron-regulated protein
MQITTRHFNLFPGLLMASLISAPLVSVPLASVAGQTDLHHAIGDPARKDTEVKLVLDGVVDTATGETVSPAEMAARLADVGLMFIGESHTSIEYHRVQLRVIQELNKAGREVMIGLEMFPYTQQAALDKWIDGDQSEQAFVDEAEWYKYWGYNWEYYREIFVYARENGLRMYGVNTPRDVVSAVRKKGFKNLTPEEAEHIPHRVMPVTDDQRALYKSFFDPNDALHMSEDRLEGMLRAQTTWDATMGWNALQALLKDGGDNAIMVVLIGSGHVTYGLGAERQTAPYYDGDIASLIPVQVADDDGVPVETVRASYTNFLWGLPKEDFEIYPSFGASLMGKIGTEPTKIIQLSEGSVAERAGIKIGDVLLSLAGEAVNSGVDLRRIVSGLRWGDVSLARISRDGEEQDIVVPVRRDL